MTEAETLVEIARTALQRLWVVFNTPPEEPHAQDNAGAVLKALLNVASVTLDGSADDATATPAPAALPAPEQLTETLP